MCFRSLAFECYFKLWKNCFVSNVFDAVTQSFFTTGKSHESIKLKTWKTTFNFVNKWCLVFHFICLEIFYWLQYFVWLLNCFVNLKFRGESYLHVNLAVNDLCLGCGNHHNNLLFGLIGPVQTPYFTWTEFSSCEVRRLNQFETADIIRIGLAVLHAWLSQE